MSFLSPPETVRALIKATGLTESSWIDETERTLLC